PLSASACPILARACDKSLPRPVNAAPLRMRACLSSAHSNARRARAHARYPRSRHRVVKGRADRVGVPTACAATRAAPRRLWKGRFLARWPWILLSLRRLNVGCTRRGHKRFCVKELSMTGQKLGLTRIILRLGRNPDAGYPDGADDYGYVINAPLDVNGKLDAALWRETKE